MHTILPLLNISAVVRGTRILMMRAAKRFGLYSELRAIYLVRKNEFSLKSLKNS